jgi:hypothetical protein
MGTPAVLNLSLPATMLRATDGGALGPELPDSWSRGNDPRAVDLSRGRVALSATTAGVVLLAGVAVVWCSASRRGADMVPLLSALVVVALVAAPISWYHYRLLHFPGIAWLAVSAARKGAWARLVGVVALALALTWAQALESVVVCPPPVVLLRGAAVVALEGVLFGLLVRGMGRQGQRSGSGAATTVSGRGSTQRQPL